MVAPQVLGGFEEVVVPTVDGVQVRHLRVYIFVIQVLGCILYQSIRLSGLYLVGKCYTCSKLGNFARVFPKVTHRR